MILAESADYGVSIQTMLGLMVSIGSVLAVVITALYKSNNSRIEATEARLTTDLKNEREERNKSNAEVKELIGKVGVLEGKSSAYTEVKKSLTVIEETANEVLKAVSNTKNE